MISFFEKSIQNQNATPTQNLDFDGLVNGVKKHWSETLTKFHAQCFERGLKYGDEDYKRLKLKLPYFTPHGSFLARKNAGLKKLSGFFLFDFDLQDNQNISPLVVREHLEADKFTRFLFRSPSGGLKFFVEYEERTLQNVEDFLEYYKQVVRYFEGRYRIKLDTSQGKLSQPCFISFDANAFVNTESEKFFLSRVLTEEEKNQPQPKQENSTDSVFKWIEGILSKKKFFLRRGVGTNMFTNLLVWRIITGLRKRSVEAISIQAFRTLPENHLTLYLSLTRGILTTLENGNTRQRSNSLPKKPQKYRSL